MKITRTRLVVGIAGITLLAVITLGTAWVLYKRAHPPLSPEQLFTIGRNNLEGRQFTKAYSFLERAARAEPQNTAYQWAAAEAARARGRREDAQRHAQAAWDAGLRRADVLLVLDETTTFRSTEERLRSTLEWLRRLPDDPARRELEGDLHYRASHAGDSLKVWEPLFASTPSAPLAIKIGFAWLALEKPGKASEFLAGLRGGPHLDEEGYGLLASLYAYQDKVEEAKAVFAEGRTRFPGGENLRMNEAIFLIVQGRAADAAERLDPIKGHAADPSAEGLHGQARLFLAFLLAARGDLASLGALEALADGDAAVFEGERLYYRALRSETSDLKLALEELKKARTLLSGSPAVSWSAARAFARAGSWTEAVAAYRGISGLLGRAPTVRLEFAQALRRAGKPDEALNTLSRLHARRIYSKASLELYRDLAFERNLVREGKEAQQLLEKEFKDDPGVLMAGGALALRSGNTAEATAVFEALASRFPQREDVEIARLSVFARRGDYEGLLKACGESRAPAATLAPLQGIALVKLGRPAEAEAFYGRALKERRDPGLVLAYGNLLLLLQKPDKAAQAFGEVLREQPKNEGAHLGLAAIALQRRAWKEAREHARIVDASGALSAFCHLVLAEADLEEGQFERGSASCDRALQLDPDNFQARFLKGVASLELGRYAEAEALLERCAAAQPGSAVIVGQLARAKMSRGAPEEALQVVDAALARAPSNTLPLETFRLVLLAHTGKIDEARALLARVRAQLTPGAALLAEAWLLQREGRVDVAIALLGTRLEDSTVAVPWAELRLRQGQGAGVVEALDRHPLDARRWIALAELAREKGPMGVAAALYERALRQDPENPSILNNYAYASLQQETFDAEAVLRAARKACALVPDNVHILDTYVTGLLRCRKERECVEFLEGSRRVMERSARLRFVLAQAYEREGQPAKALGEYTACLDHPETAGIASGELSRPALQKRIDELRTKLPNR